MDRKSAVDVGAAAGANADQRISTPPTSGAEREFHGRRVIVRSVQIYIPQSLQCWIWGRGVFFDCQL